MIPKVTIGKYNGDDCYSWAVFVNGRPAMTGLGREQARFHRKQLKDKYRDQRRITH
jgi:hypothetical protein